MLTYCRLYRLSSRNSAINGAAGSPRSPAQRLTVGDLDGLDELAVPLSPEAELAVARDAVGRRAFGRAVRLENDRIHEVLARDAGRERRKAPDQIRRQLDALDLADQPLALERLQHGEKLAGQRRCALSLKDGPGHLVGLAALGGLALGDGQVATIRNSGSVMG